MKYSPLMKFSCAFLFSFFFLDLKAQVYNGNLTLATQAEIDAFNYTEVTGNLEVGKVGAYGDIMNIDGLSELTKVGGDLRIYDNYSFDHGLGWVGVTNINALSNLTTVGGSLQITWNVVLSNVDGLTNLVSVGKNVDISNNGILSFNVDGLNSLTSVGGNFNIAYNANGVMTDVDGLSSLTYVAGEFEIIQSYLNSIAGLSSLTSVGGNFFLPRVNDNSPLTHLTTIGGKLIIGGVPAFNVDGLANLISVGGYVSVYDNSNLLNLDGLSHLTAIHGLGISSNASLQNLYGLSNVTSVTGIMFNNYPLIISDNAQLTNLDGLSKLISVDHDLAIENNTALTSFCGLYALLSANGLGGSYTVSGNGINPTEQQIISGGACTFSIYYGDVTLSTQSAVDNFNYTQVTGLLIINDEIDGDITNLDGLLQLNSVGGLVINNNPGLTNLNGLSGLASAGSFQILNNDALINLNGLSKLKTVDGDFNISSDDALANVDGLLALSSIGGALVIYSNPALTNLNALSHLTKASLSISQNASLVNLDGFSNLTSVGYIILSNNNALTNIDALSGVVSLESILAITENAALTNINGLSNLTSIGSSSNPWIPSLTIGNNLSLTNLDGLSKLVKVERNLSIVGNQLLVRFCGLYLLISSNGLTGTYTVFANAFNPTQQQIIDGGVCTNNVCPTAGTMNVSLGTGSTINFQLQGSDVNNDPLSYSITQSPSHGVATTTSTGMASYTPTIGYVGSDLFQYKVSDSHCEAEGTANITILICPAPIGYWKNRPEAWPTNVTPMLLGTRLYTQTQLLSILNLRPGNGSRADASLILVNQEIATKLNIANGAAVAPGIADSITSADALIGDNLIPMSVKPNTTLGKRMTAIATFLASYNNGLLTPGCSVPANQAVPQLIVENYNHQASTGFVLEQNHPNPFSGSTTIRYALPEGGNVFYHVSLKLYDVAGREVKTLVNDVQNGGWKTVNFDLRTLETGTYFYRLTANEFSEVRKMILLK